MIFYIISGRIYLEKCGEDKLQNAGECFFLAGCYTLAAEVYAKGNYFSECLMVCSKAKLFDKGLHYISCWKQIHHGNNLTTYKGEELGDIEQGFLESCALHYYELKDNRSMMKFVKGFNSIDSKRNFLTNLDCLDELLMVEEKLGNFREAIEIAKLKGELLLEAELHKKAKNFKEAAMLMLWSVFANSLWVSKGRGWPLKHFADAKLILAKAQSLAKKESATFYEFVSNEVSILRNEDSNLSQLHGYLSAFRINKNLKGEVRAVWKMLDVHLGSRVSKYEWEHDMLHGNVINHCEENLSRNCVTLETLIYSWNLFKKIFENLFKCLIGIENQSVNDTDGYSDFCMNYFGVRRQVDGVTIRYFLTRKDAYWARDIDKRFLLKRGNLVSVNVLQFVSAAKNHFRLELLSVGLKLLHTLEALHEQANKYFAEPAFCESTTHIFDVAKYLLESKYLDIKNHDVKKLKYFLDATSIYFEHAFPLDGRKMFSENMISLRRSDRSRYLLEDITLRKIGLKGDVKYGEIGRMVMIMLSSRKLSKELYHKILENFEGNNRWKELVMEIGGRTCSDNSQDSSSVETTSLCKLFRASQDTYNEIWRSLAYISPFSFFYLVDRLLLMSSFTRDFFFTIKSSFVEWVISGDSCLNAVSSFGGDDLLTKDIFEFLATIIEQLLTGSINMSEWVKRSGLSMNYGCQMLVMRMVLTLCLVCVNSGAYFDILSRVLKNNNISSWMPMELVRVFGRMEEGNHAIVNLNILADLLETFRDPLVLVTMRGNHSKLILAELICVDMKATSCKEDTLKILLPVQNAVSPGQDVDVEATKLCNNDRNEQFTAAQKTESESKKDAKLKASSYSKEKLPKDYPLLSKKRTAIMKEYFGGLEAMDPDEKQRLYSALDRRDLDEYTTIMWQTMRKQYALTGDPSIHAFMENFLRKKDEGNLRSFDKYRNRSCTSHSQTNNDNKEDHSENKNKGKGKAQERE